MTAAPPIRVPLAGLVASLLTALTLVPLIRGTGWLSAAFAMLAVVAAVGVLLRQVIRVWPVVVAGQGVALALTVTALFARDSTVWGPLPGPETLADLQHLLSAGLEVTRRQTPPVEATRGLILLAAGGVSLVGFAVDVIAVSLRRPAVAGLPLLAVYCVPTAVLPGGLDWPYFVLAGTGFLILVGADAGDRVRDWGRVLGDGPREELPPGAPLRGARRVGAVSLAVAAVVPALIPGLGDRLVGPPSGPGAGDGDESTIRVVNPILDLRRNLGSRSDAVVLTYRSDAPSPAPLRIVTDDSFNGTTWAPSVGTILRSQEVQSGMPVPPGLSSQVPVVRHSTQIKVGDLEETYLPLPYPATRVDISGTWLWDADTFNVVGWGTTTKEQSYRVDHLDVRPTSEQLAGAGPAPSSVVTRYTALPSNLAPEIAATAQRVAGTGTPYRQAVRMQSWFRSGGGFTYSETLPGDGRSDSGQDAVATFLRQREGYCVQFASAMAVMARTLGIPARVAVGFLPGDRALDGTYSIRLRDAHAWPELYFEGTGWVRFEPTPTLRAGAAPDWTVPPAPTPTTSPSPGPTSAPVPSRGSATVRPDRGVEPSTDPALPSPPVRVLRAVPWRAAGVVLLLLLLLTAPRLAVVAVHGRRWRSAGSPRERAEAAWEELRERLSDLGVNWPGSWTPRSVQRWLSAERELDGPATAALARLVDDLERARYARPSQLSRPAGERVEDLRVVARAVSRTVGRRAWWRALLVPASGMAALARVLREVDVAADEASRRASALRDQARRSVGNR